MAVTSIEPATRSGTPMTPSGPAPSPSRESSSTGPERLSVNVSAVTAESLRTIRAKRGGGTVTEVIRRAVAVLKRLEDAEADGYELHLVNRKTKEVRIIELI